MTPEDRYVSPLASRNASAEMQAIWSPRRKFTTWRQLWITLAEAEHELGLPVTGSQIEALRGARDDLDLEAAAAYEKKLRHDVMAHVHAYGDVAPEARGIIHLGATSQFVNCNTELILIRDALELVAGKLASAIDHLARFAAEHRSLATLGFTHLQPAQPTTVGKRACLWLQELAIGLGEIEHRIETLPLRGVKGTTGTQASFLALFRALEGVDEAEAQRRVEELDRLVCAKLGWPGHRRLPISGQTYPRVIDGLVLASLGSVAAAAHKMATDIRLLASRKELEEPFEKNQIGSSAMAYKRNPMRCERICGLSRFVIGMIQTPYVTAAEQWMERTLDDSSTRRLTLPEPFLALDGVLEILNNVSTGLVVYPAVIKANLDAELPFMATEEILMAAVRQGVDRQEAHEVIRTHSMEAARQVKEQGCANDLLDRLRGEAMFAGVELDSAMDASAFIGRAPQQVDQFIAQVVEPIRKRYADRLGHQADLKV